MEAGGGGIMDVLTRRALGLENKLVCSFKLATVIVRGAVRMFVYDMDRPANSERGIWWDCV